VSSLPVSHPTPPDPPELPAGASARPRWAAWTALAALVSALLMALIGAALVGGIGSAVGASFEDPPPAVNIAATFVQDICFIAAAIIFARLAGRPTPAQFGLRPPSRPWHALGWVVGGYLLFLIVSGIWLQALGTNPEDELPESLGADESTAALVAVVIVVTVLAPIAEEILFRGYIFTALRGRAGVWGAAILSGLVFGGVHAVGSPIEFLLPLAFLGFVLCIVYWKTGSLYPSIGLHALNNSIAIGVNQGWDWQIPLIFAGALAVIAAILAPVVRRYSPQRTAAA